MKAKINKALDYNLLLLNQEKGKLLKKHIQFPILASIKYDGNYVVAEVQQGGKVIFTTSGGLKYTHTDNGGDCFKNVNNGFYLVERIWGEGKLGDRDRCNLRGPKKSQTSTGHTYKVHDLISYDDFIRGYTNVRHTDRQVLLANCGINEKYIAKEKIIRSRSALDKYLAEVVEQGYEGLMGKSPDWKWENTTSRRVDNFKYKGRPTVDLLCIGFNYAEVGSKYEGLVGSLTVKDKIGRVVNVGSGLSDAHRALKGEHFIGKVIEIDYERIKHTYIQPSVVDIRYDKNEKDID